MNHLGNDNKMVSDTPRTDAIARINEYLGVGGLFDPEILNVQQHEAVRDTLIQARDELNAANDRIKRLEEAGDAMDKTAEPFVLDTIDEDIPMSKVGEQYEIIYDSPPTAGDHVAMDRARKEWRKAKEAKP